MSNESEGLDLSNLDTLTEEEKNANLVHVWSWRGPLYHLYANSLVLDYASPEFNKLNRAAMEQFGRPDLVNILLLGTQNLASYIMQGWETGILNQVGNTLRRNGLTTEEMMELVMFTQLYAGMRGLGHVYRAVGDVLPALGPPQKAPVFAKGWAPDPDAFKSGLDLSVRTMTSADLENLTGWYERTLGYLPKSVAFGIKYHPEFVKVNRAKWEVAIRTLPKQFAPHLMVRLNMMSGNVEGLREAVQLSKAWGISRLHVLNSILATAFYFTGFEGLHPAHRAVDDILDSWDE